MPDIHNYSDSDDHIVTIFSIWTGTISSNACASMRTARGHIVAFYYTRLNFVQTIANTEVFSKFA